MRLILASGSPRRADLLRAAGFTFDVVVPDIDETQRDGEASNDYVRRLSMEKSHAVAQPFHDRLRVTESSSVPPTILAADTAVVVDGAVLGKPADDADAARMLRQLSGRWHEVLTGVSVRFGSRESGSVEVTRVEVAPLSPDEVAWYVTNGEGRDKAGAYAIQGLASRFIPRIEGSYTNVVGLPIALVQKLLKSVETRYPDA